MHLDVYLVNMTRHGKRASYILFEQEINSIRGSLYSFGENVLFFDLDGSKVETLFIFLYHTPHFQDGPIEVHFLKSDVDWEIG